MFSVLLKGGTHKYIKREPVGDGKYRYWYKSPKGGLVSSDGKHDHSESDHHKVESKDMGGAGHLMREISIKDPSKPGGKEDHSYLVRAYAKSSKVAIRNDALKQHKKKHGIEKDVKHADLKNEAKNAIHHVQQSRLKNIKKKGDKHDAKVFVYTAGEEHPGEEHDAKALGQYAVVNRNDKHEVRHLPSGLRLKKFDNEEHAHQLMEHLHNNAKHALKNVKFGGNITKKHEKDHLHLSSTLGSFEPKESEVESSADYSEEDVENTKSEMDELYNKMSKEYESIVSGYSAQGKNQSEYSQEDKDKLKKFDKLESALSDFDRSHDLGDHTDAMQIAEKLKETAKDLFKSIRSFTMNELVGIEIIKGFAVSEPEPTAFPIIVKGKGHKYVKRERYTSSTGKKRYRYWYRSPKGGIVSSDGLKEGTAFRHGSGDSRGHYHVKKVHKDASGKVTHVDIEHDELKHGHKHKVKEKVSIEKLKQMMHYGDHEKPGTKTGEKDETAREKTDRLRRDFDAAGKHGSYAQFKKMNDELNAHLDAHPEEKAYHQDKMIKETRAELKKKPKEEKKEPSWKKPVAGTKGNVKKMDSMIEQAQKIKGKDPRMSAALTDIGIGLQAGNTKEELFKDVNDLMRQHKYKELSVDEFEKIISGAPSEKEEKVAPKEEKKEDPTKYMGEYEKLDYKNYNKLKNDVAQKKEGATDPLKRKPYPSFSEQKAWRKVALEDVAPETLSKERASQYLESGTMEIPDPSVFLSMGEYKYIVELEKQYGNKSSNNDIVRKISQGKIPKAKHDKVVPDSDSEKKEKPLTRKQKESHIWKKVHKDFKGGKGKDRNMMVPNSFVKELGLEPSYGTSTFVYFSELNDEQLDKLYENRVGPLPKVEPKEEKKLSRSQMENQIAGKIPKGMKRGKGANRIIMLTGDAAKAAGLMDYAPIKMSNLTNDKIEKLHDFLNAGKKKEPKKSDLEVVKEAQTKADKEGKLLKPEKKESKSHNVTMYSKERYKSKGVTKTVWSVNDPVHGNHEYTTSGSSPAERKKKALEAHAKKHGIEKPVKSVQSEYAKKESEKKKATKKHVKDHQESGQKFTPTTKKTKSDFYVGLSGDKPEKMTGTVLGQYAVAKKGKEWRLYHGHLGMTLKTNLGTKKFAIGLMEHLHEKHPDTFSDSKFGEQPKDQKKIKQFQKDMNNYFYGAFEKSFSVLTKSDYLNHKDKGAPNDKEYKQRMGERVPYEPEQEHGVKKAMHKGELKIDGKEIKEDVTIEHDAEKALKNEIDECKKAFQLNPSDYYPDESLVQRERHFWGEDGASDMDGNHPFEMELVQPSFQVIFVKKGFGVIKN